MKRTLYGLLCVVLFLVTGTTFAQNATTSLRGIVKDPSGALVPGAKVTVTNKAIGKVFNAVSNGSGYYVLAQLPPAKYTIAVTANGFGEQSKSAELLVNQPATIDFVLSLQASTETVDVSASAQTLNTTDATLGESIGNETIQALPMEGRDPVSLLALQPGVLYLGDSKDTDDSRQGAVSGSRSDQGNVTLDGIDDNDQVNGYAFMGVLRSTMDSTEEFRVTTSNGNADAGRGSGAQVTLVTKSGTNALHGSLYEYHRPSNMVANDWFIKEEQLASGEENRPTKYIMNTFGGSISGPVLKDKLFFFFNYEGQRRATNATVSATTPSSGFLSGKLGYTNVDGGYTTLTSAQVATLDAACTLCSTPGVNAAMLGYLGTEPAATNLSGGDGVNYGTYTFSSPEPATENTSIFKLDYSLNAKNRFFARANMQKDTKADDQNLPGQPASYWHEDNTKGIAFGHTITPTSSIVNDLRYAFIRQGYSDAGVGEGDYVTVRFLTQPTSHSRDSMSNVPVHTIVDNFSLTKGNHTISLGANWRMVLNNTSNNTNSFSGATTNPSFLSAKNLPDPSTLKAGLPEMDSNYAQAFYYMYATIVGDVAERISVANYKVTSPTSATLLSDGAMISRHFKANEFEYYLQDSWKVRPNLTVTYGLRHTLLQTPYETKGQEIAPTIDTHDWYLKRGAAAAKGEVYEDDLSFTPVGKANGKPGYWAKQKMNIAPRVSLVYSPNSKTSIRTGGGLYFDHYGEALTHQFSTKGSFGLSSQYTSSANAVNYETAPRFTGGHDIPTALSVPASPTTQSYPYTVPDGTFGINWGIDNQVKTPYVEAFNLSVERELPGGLLVDVAYVGRLGRHLFQQLDLAEPVNLVDPKGAGDYFTAGTALSKLTDENAGNYGYTDSTRVAVTKIQYFEDVFPQMKNLDYAGESATEAIYNDEWAPQRYSYGETGALYDIDFGCYYGCPNGTQFWQQQFSSLIALSSIGKSSYHAGQLTLRYPTRHGLNMDFSYTLSKSIDQGSDAERSGTSYGAIQNVWNPRLSRGVSDFDTRQLITIDWNYALPLGRGKAFLAGSGKLGDALWGGWQWSGLGRWTSGLPFALTEPGWTTNWELQAWAVPTKKVKIRKHVENGLPQVFDDVDSITGGMVKGDPIRLPYPGEAGTRNAFRGDGVFDIDSALAKNWKIGERSRLKFDMEVFNVTNSIRFDTSSLGNGFTYGGFGYYSSRLGDKTFRRMQFGLRFDF